MTLTPIRVRGKRKTPSAKPPATASAVPRASGEGNPSSSAIPKASSNLTITHPSSNPQLPLAKKMRRSLSTVLTERVSRRQRASLASLPAELLETILLFSANLSLPRASNLLGAKLSGRATRLRLFIWAFHDTWDQWFGIPTAPGVLEGPDVKDPTLKTCGGDPEFQSAILELPWVDIDFILQAQQTWADTYARGRHYQHFIHLGITTEAVAAARDHDFSGGPGHFDARACFEADYQQALRWSPFEANDVPWTSPQPWGGQDVHPRTRIPPSLIAGPWDDEAQRRLLWLVRGGVAISTRPGPHQQGPPSWELRVACLQNAIINAPEPNGFITNCLMWSWLFHGLPRDVMREELRRLDRRLEWGDDSAESTELLRYVQRVIGLWIEVSETEDWGRG